MKKIFTLLAACSFAVAANSQIYFEDDFEGGSLTGNEAWTTFTTDMSYDWGHQDLGSSGDFYAVMSNYDGTNNHAVTSWLISPAIDISSATAPYLSFDNAYSYLGDALEVYVSTDYPGTGDPGTVGTWTDLSSSVNWSTGFFSWVTSGDVDLAAHISANTYIAYKYVGTGSDGSTWEIDDVLVQEGMTVIPTLTIYDIQYTLANPADSPEEGNTVTTSGVVTAMSTGDSGDGYFIQDADGAWNGIVVVDVANTPSVGDSVEVTAVVEENFDMTRLVSVSAYTNHGAAGWTPTAEVISSNDAATLEDYESVLVTVENAECTNDNAGFGLWESNDGSGALNVDDDCFDNSATLGDWYDITGPISYSFSEYKINPRGGGDIVMVEGAGIGSNEFEFTVYPNPANENVVVNTIAGSTVSVYSMTGALVASGVSNKTIDVSGLTAGIYQVTVVSNGVQATQKLVIR